MLNGALFSLTLWKLFKYLFMNFWVFSCSGEIVTTRGRIFSIFLGDVVYFDCFSLGFFRIGCQSRSTLWRFGVFSMSSVTTGEKLTFFLESFFFDSLLLNGVTARLLTFFTDLLLNESLIFLLGDLRWGEGGIWTFTLGVEKLALFFLIGDLGGNWLRTGFYMSSIGVIIIPYLPKLCWDPSDSTVAIFSVTCTCGEFLVFLKICLKSRSGTLLYFAAFSRLSRGSSNGRIASIST